MCSLKYKVAGYLSPSWSCWPKNSSLGTKLNIAYYGQNKEGRSMCVPIIAGKYVGNYSLNVSSSKPNPKLIVWKKVVRDIFLY